jgi:cytochrome b561
MPETATLHHYDRVSRAFHWIMAGLIFGLMILGLTVDAFPRAWESTIVGLHTSFGTLTLLLLALRLVWRLGHKAPPLAADLSSTMRRLSALGHLALYALMAATLFAGLATAFTRGLSIDLLAFKIPSPMAADRALARPAKEVHELLSSALMALVGVHILAAFWHERVLRDGTLQRMLAPRSQTAINN